MKGAFLPNAEQRKEGAFCYIITTMLGGKKLRNRIVKTQRPCARNCWHDVYAGAFAGTPSHAAQKRMRSKKADDEELEEIARRHGIKETQTYGKERNI